MADVRFPRRVPARAMVALMLVVSAGCQTRGTPNPNAFLLAGTWNVSLVSGGSMQFGLQLRPSGRDSLTGRIIRMLSGNVEIDVSEFSPLEGKLLGERVVLQSNPVSPRAFRFELLVGHEDLQVISIHWMGDELVTPAQQWKVTRGE